MKRGPQLGKSAGVSLANARRAWGEPTPDWIVALAEACDGTTQAKAARAIGYQGSVVSSVLSRKYKGNMARVEAAVSGAFMNATVDCPVLDEIKLNACLSYQKREFAATGSSRTKLWKACRGCPERRQGGASC